MAPAFHLASCRRLLRGNSLRQRSRRSDHGFRFLRTGLGSSFRCDMKYAVILAGGRGTRLRPYTLTLPKPLVPLVDTPIVEIVIRKLANAGYDVVTLAINHMGELIQAYFGNGGRWGLIAKYSLEDEPLGTIAPLRLITDLPENFLVINADVLSDLDLSKFLNDHIETGAIFTIAATSREQVL